MTFWARHIVSVPFKCCDLLKQLQQVHSIHNLLENYILNEQSLTLFLHNNLLFVEMEVKDYILFILLHLIWTD